MLGAAVLVAAGGGMVWFWPPGETLRNERIERQLTETGDASGKILGLTIGSTMQEAREKLDPLRVPTDYVPDEKEESGRRVHWKLKETDYDWVMAWALLLSRTRSRSPVA